MILANSPKVSPLIHIVFLTQFMRIPLKICCFGRFYTVLAYHDIITFFQFPHNIIMFSHNTIMFVGITLIAPGNVIMGCDYNIMRIL